MSGAIYVCIKQFNARLGDELNLKVGDRIEVLADDSEYNDGWYMGRNVVSNKVGLFPKSFTQLALETKLDPPLLRLRSRRLPGGAKGNDAALPVAPLEEQKSVQPSKDSTSSQKPTSDVHHTMSEIDRALQELRMLKDAPAKQLTADLPQQQKQATLDPQKGHLRTSSSVSLTQDLNPLKAREWTPKQVSLYFAIVLGFDMDVAGKFARHKITGEILFELDLAHLKELEIDSFGTRFEVYKEIEKLKQISSRAKTLNPPPLNGLLTTPLGPKHTLRASPPFNNLDEDRNKSSDNSLLLPSVQLGSKDSLGRNASTSFLPLSSSTQAAESGQYSTEKSPAEFPGSFMSPRRAPEPPSQSPMNRNYRFGGSPMTPQNNGLHGLYKTRTNASSAALSSANGNTYLRPASSVYDGSVMIHHRRGSSGISNSHRRHSSVFSFLSGNNDEPLGTKEKLQSQNLYKEDTSTPRHVSSPVKHLSKYLGDDFVEESVDIDDVGLSPRKVKSGKPVEKDKEGKKEENPQSRLKSLRSVSTQNFRNLTVLKKLKTSAFQEGIRDINPDDAIKSSNYSGWMSKKSGSTLGWRSRYFTLHGTRLSYFTSLRDKREKGLIDITAHKVIPISTEGDQSASNDKYIALYAALTGFGRYCFKLVPPAPGFKKGLTFTQPKTHYFAVETQEEMRGWLKALMTATIDIDDSVPVVSSCNTPTVTLAKAQELLAKAREETKIKDEELRARGFLRDGEYLDDETMRLTYYNNSATSEEASPIVGSIDETTISSTTAGTNGGANGLTSSSSHPKLTVDTLTKNYRTPSTPQVSNNSGGFASPYLLASGLLSPKLGNNGVSNTSNSSTPYIVLKKDYFEEGELMDESVRPPKIEEGTPSQKSIGSSSPKQFFTHSNGRLVSGSKKKEKMMAYTNEGSFVIKQKK